MRDSKRMLQMFYMKNRKYIYSMSNIIIKFNVAVYYHIFIIDFKQIA